MRLNQTVSTATLAAALLAGVAMAPILGLAQTTTQQPAQQTGQAATTQQPTQATQDGFLLRQAADQILVSNLMGVDVIGAAGENIGNVDDIVADHEGRVLGIVVGVGGFLGMGQKDVAIPMNALSFDIEGAPAATGTAATPADRTTWGWGTDRVNRVIVQYTEQQLEAAPEFRRFDE